MAKTKQDEAAPLAALDMTPMIDATFNLLIFFLCNINFRALDGKLPLFLPKDAGVNSARQPLPLEPLSIDVARRVPADVRDPAWTWDERQLAIRVQGRAVRGLEELAELLDRARGRDPSLRVLLRPGRGTLYIDTVKVVNECLRARATDVALQGVASDS